MSQQRQSEAQLVREMEIAARDIARGLSVYAVKDPGQLPEQSDLAVILLPVNLEWSEDQTDRKQVLDFVSRVSDGTPSGPRKLRNNLVFLARVRTAEAVRYRLLLRVRVDGTEPLLLPDQGDTTGASLMKSVWEAAVAKHWIIPDLDVEELAEFGLLHRASTIRASDIVTEFQQSPDLPMIASGERIVDAIIRGCHAGKVDLLNFDGPHPTRLTCLDAELRLRDKPTEVGVRLGNQTRDRRRRGEQRSQHGSTDGSGGLDNHIGSVVRFPNERLVDSGEQDGGRSAPATKLIVHHIALTGTVDDAKYGDLFRTVIAPLRRMNARHVTLAIHIDADIPPTDSLAPGDPFVRRLRESARRLGFELDVHVKPTSPDAES